MLLIMFFLKYILQIRINLIAFRDTSEFVNVGFALNMSPHQGDKVGGSNTAVWAWKLSCRAWEPDWNVDVPDQGSELIQGCTAEMLNRGNQGSEAIRSALDDVCFRSNAG